jgi:hypothetical protein
MRVIFRLSSLLAFSPEKQSRSTRRLSLAALFSAMLSIVAINAAQAAPEVAANDSTTLTQLNLEILHKALELERSNVVFLIHSHPELRWKPWRYFAFQETGASLLEAGLVTGIADREHQIHHGGKVSGVLIENSLTPQMIGQLINATGDFVELSFNAKSALKSKADLLDPHTAKTNAIRLHKELDQLLVAREQFLQRSNALSEDQKSVAAIEGRVMRDEERLSWLQYSRSLMDARKLSIVDNSFYLIDVARNFSGAGGNIVGLTATHWAQPRLNIGANILTAVSGGIAMTNPILSRISGRVGAYLQGSHLDREYNPCITGVVSDLLNHEAGLRLLIAEQGSESISADRLLFDRIAVYERELERATEVAQKLRKADRRANTAALGRISVGLLVGGSKVASGVSGIRAADRLSANAGAGLLLGGTTAYASGVGLTLADNVNINVRREIRYVHDRNNQILPRDILQQDLSEIERLDKRLSQNAAKLNSGK